MTDVMRRAVPVHTRVLRGASRYASFAVRAAFVFFVAVVSMRDVHSGVPSVL